MRDLGAAWLYSWASESLADSARGAMAIARKERACVGPQRRLLTFRVDGPDVLHFSKKCCRRCGQFAIFPPEAFIFGWGYWLLLPLPEGITANDQYKFFPWVAYEKAIWRSSWLWQKNNPVDWSQVEKISPWASPISFWRHSNKRAPVLGSGLFNFIVGDKRMKD